MAGTKTRRLAWAFLFLLAMQEVSAHRVKLDVRTADARVASGLDEATRVNGNLDAMKEAREFSIKTHWARGKESKLKWTEAELSFSIIQGSASENSGKTAGPAPAEYVQLAVNKEKYTIMPDAAVVAKTINGMALVSILGWKRDGDEAPVYNKKDALYFRTEMNPFVGLTKDDFWSWRYAGHKVYEPRDQTKNPYYIREDGKMFVIKRKDVNREGSKSEREPFQVWFAGQSKVMTRPDTDLMLLLDTMLGQSSCLNNPSQCAFRCSYNPVTDTCGPSSFCSKVQEATPPGGRLAPFGQQQKCEALGSEKSHEEADEVLAGKGLDGLKEKALGLVVSLAEAPAISKKQASQSTMKKTMDLFQEASDILNTIQTLPTRLSPDFGNFPTAAARIAKQDFRHWRASRFPLSLKQYIQANGKSVEDLRKSQKFSVAAKLHGGMVDFLVKRPRFLIDAAKLSTGPGGKQKQCVLSDDSPAARDKLKTFVKYYMAAPGFNKKDVSGGTTGLGEGCEFFLAGLRSDMLEKADQGENAILDKDESKDKDRGKSIQGMNNNDRQDGEHNKLLLVESAAKWQEVAATVLPAEGQDLAKEMRSDGGGGGEGQGESIQDKEPDLALALDQDLSLLQQTDEAAFVWIVMCIIVCVICCAVAGTLLALAGMALKSGAYEGYFIAGVLGGLVIWGAFCMATPVGWVALVVSLVAGVVAAGALAEMEGSERTGEPSRSLPLSISLPEEATKKKNKNLALSMTMTMAKPMSLSNPGLWVGA